MAKPRWLESPTVVELDTEDQARRGDEARNDVELAELLRFHDVARPPDPWELIEYGAWFRDEHPMPEPSPDQETEA